MGKDSIERKFGPISFKALSILHWDSFFELKKKDPGSPVNQNMEEDLRSQCQRQSSSELLWNIISSTWEVKLSLIWYANCLTAIWKLQTNFHHGLILCLMFLFCLPVCQLSSVWRELFQFLSILSPSKCSPSSYLAFTNYPNSCLAPTLLLSPRLFLSPRISFQSYSRRWTPVIRPPSLEPYPASPWMTRTIPSCQLIRRGEWGSTSAPSPVTSPLPTS